MAPSKDSAFKSMKRLWKGYIRDCKRRNVFWELPLELFHRLTSQPCAYCGKPPSQKRREYVYSGLDRMNPAKGYETTNVVPCCKECNWIKGDRLSYEEMKVVGEALSSYRKTKAA